MTHPDSHAADAARTRRRENVERVLAAFAPLAAIGVRVSSVANGAAVTVTRIIVHARGVRADAGLPDANEVRDMIEREGFLVMSMLTYDDALTGAPENDPTDRAEPATHPDFHGQRIAFDCIDASYESFVVARSGSAGPTAHVLLADGSRQPLRIVATSSTSENHLALTGPGDRVAILRRHGFNTIDGFRNLTMERERVRP